MLGRGTTIYSGFLCCGDVAYLSSKTFYLLLDIYGYVLRKETKSIDTHW